MINRRTFLSRSLLGAGAAAAWPLLAGAQTGGTAPRNVICMLCDDMGAPELGCYGNTVHRTPHLEAALAALPFPESTQADRDKFHTFTQRHLRVLNRYIATLENVPPRKASRA